MKEHTPYTKNKREQNHIQDKKLGENLQKTFFQLLETNSSKSLELSDKKIICILET